MPKAKARNQLNPKTSTEVRYVTIRVPVVDVSDEGYIPAHLAVNLQGHRGGMHMRKALLTMNRALNQTHAQFQSGRHVDDNASVVRWILEQYAEAMNAPAEVEAA